MGKKQFGNLFPIIQDKKKKIASLTRLTGGQRQIFWSIPLPKVGYKK